MNSIETAGMAWIKTAFFGTVVLLLASALNFILNYNILNSNKSISILVIPFLFLIFVFCFLFSLAWSIAQLIATVYLLKYIYYLNIEIQTQINLTVVITLFFSVLTASFVSLLYYNSLIFSFVSIGTLPYIPTSSIIMYREATIFFKQNQID